MSIATWFRSWREARTLKVSWSREGERWNLDPVPISVRPTAGYWEIFVHESPTNLNYSNAEGAKRDALQMVRRKCLQYFGASRVRLVDK